MHIKLKILVAFSSRHFSTREAKIFKFNNISILNLLKVTRSQIFFGNQTSRIVNENETECRGKTHIKI